MPVPPTCRVAAGTVIATHPSRKSLVIRACFACAPYTPRTNIEGQLHKTDMVSIWSISSSLILIQKSILLAVILLSPKRINEILHL